LLQQDRTWILTACVKSRLVGFAVFELRDIPSLGLTRTLFVDLQTLSRDRSLCRAMTDFAFNRCRRDGIHVLENVGCWLEKLQPIQPAPYHRSLESWCYLYKVINPALMRSLKNSSAWYPTQYDGDASL